MFKIFVIFNINKSYNINLLFNNYWNSKIKIKLIQGKNCAGTVTQNVTKYFTRRNNLANLNKAKCY